MKAFQKSKRITTLNVLKGVKSEGKATGTPRARTSTDEDGAKQTAGTSPKSPSEAGNILQTPLLVGIEAQHTSSASDSQGDDLNDAQLKAKSDTLRKMEDLNRFSMNLNGPMVQSRSDDQVSYVQEGTDYFPFEFNEYEANFVRLVECVRKYALEDRLSNDSTLWPWYRKFRLSDYIMCHQLCLIGYLTMNSVSPSAPSTAMTYIKIVRCTTI